MRNAYLIAEFTALRSEVMFLWNEIASLQKYAVTVSTTVYGWLLLQSDRDAPLASFAWIIPLLFSTLGALRNRVYFLRMRRLGGYLRILEQEALGSSSNTVAVPLGWESYLSRVLSDNSPFLGSEAAFWRALLGINLLVSIFGLALRYV